MKATKACRKDPIYKQLAIGERVVVRCDLEAFMHDNSNSSSSSSSNNSNDDDDNSVNDVYSRRERHDNLENETIEDYKNMNKANSSNKAKSRYRCKGEGAPGHHTRFSAMAIPSCHGKWIRLTLKEPKKCSTHHDSQFIFV